MNQFQNFDFLIIFGNFWSFLRKIENFWNDRSWRIVSQNILNNSELEFIIEICKYLEVNDRIKF